MHYQKFTCWNCQTSLLDWAWLPRWLYSYEWLALDVLDPMQCPRCSQDGALFGLAYSFPVDED